jgi:predicted RNA binding protein YcfA (HicA-like mRNA interferase family)
MKPVSGREMCRARERKGWIFDGLKGSHHIYVRPGVRRIPVPVHGNRTLKPDTQRSIMRTAGLTDAEL